MKTKTTLLAAVISASLFSATSFAGYVVQPVVKKDISANISATLLATATFEIVSSQHTERKLRDRLLMNDITVTVESQDADGVLVNITNNTMRLFSDINLDLGNTGITLATPLAPFTQLTVRLASTSIDSVSAIKFLDPSPFFTPNASEYRAPSTEAEINTYQVLQNNLKVVYGQAETFDEYMRFFTNDRDEPRRNAWAKWHRTVSYDVPKSYRQTTSSSGVSGGYWHAIHSASLKLYQEDMNFYHPYATLSHENAHSTGFKHGSGMTYGWQDYMKWKAHENDVSGLTGQNSILPQTNNFFWDYDAEQKTIRLFAKEGTNFSGFDWVNIMYDSNRTRVGEVTSNFDTLQLPAAINTADAVIVLNAKIKGYDQTVNLTLKGDKITAISDNDNFLLQDDDTIASYAEKEQTHQAKRAEINKVFPESLSWSNDINTRFPAKIDFRDESRTLCKFQYTPQGLEVKTLLGVVTDDVCSIGERNSFTGVQGFSSQPNAYQVVDLEGSTLVEGNLQVTVTQDNNRLADVCLYNQDHGDYELAGVGFKSATANKCISSMVAHNGKGWGMSSSWTRVPVTPITDYLPNDANWAPLADVVNPLTVSTKNGTKTICRFAIEKTQEFGFVSEDNRSCSIGDRNSINGIKGYSKANFQVINADTGIPGEAVTVTYDNRPATICYKAGKKFAGVSVSFNNVACGMGTKALKKAYNGTYYGFSRRYNSFATF